MAFSNNLNTEMQIKLSDLGNISSLTRVPGPLCFLGKMELALLFTVQLTANPYCIYLKLQVG